MVVMTIPKLSHFKIGIKLLLKIHVKTMLANNIFTNEIPPIALWILVFLSTGIRPAKMVAQPVINKNNAPEKIKMLTSIKLIKLIGITTLNNPYKAIEKSKTISQGLLLSDNPLTTCDCIVHFLALDRKKTPKTYTPEDSIIIKLKIILKT